MNIYTKRRWQQGKDLTWYAKEGKNDDSHMEEIKAIKEAEADVMAELLGGGKRRVVTGNVTQQELSNVLKRQQEDEDGDDLKETIQEVTKGFKSSGRLSISEMIPDDTRLVSEDKSISTTNWNSNNIAESTQVSTIQLEDKKKSKKINKEKKKKKHKKDKHNDSKKKHSKRSKRDLSVSPSQYDDVSNESIRGRSRYRKIDDHTSNRDHSGEPRPYSYSISPKRDTRRYRSRSNSPKRDIRYRSYSKSPRRDALQYRSRSKSPKRDSRHRSPATRHRSRSPRYARSQSHNRHSPHYHSDDDKRKYKEFNRYSYGKGNDRRDRNYTRRSRNY